MSKPNRLSTISQQEEDEFRLLEAAANAMTLDEYDEGSIPSSGSPVKDVPGAFIGRDKFPVDTRRHFDDYKTPIQWCVSNGVDIYIFYGLVTIEVFAVSDSGTNIPIFFLKVKCVSVAKLQLFTQLQYQSYFFSKLHVIFFL